MLIQCPECKLQVSDKALACPHCGYPINRPAYKKAQRKPNKRRRLPNGFGQISEIKGRNLRKPFRAMVTVGKRANGRPVCKPLKPEAYFETYNEAYEALVEYNRNPYDLDPAMTIEELYEKWFERYEKTVGYSSAHSIQNAWEFCTAIHKMRVKDLRPRHIKMCLEEGTRISWGREQPPNVYNQAKIKTMFNMMLDYAVEFEIVDKNYARSFSLPDEVIKEVVTTKKGHMAFTDKEVDLLWENIIDEPYAKIVLVQLYTGMRPQEIGLIKLENVDLQNGFLQGGIKTAAGINRIIPIHSKISPIVRGEYQRAKELKSDYLFNVMDANEYKSHKNLSYHRYLSEFVGIVERLGLNPEHRPHDGRKHFTTMAKKYGVDEYAIKYIIGHVINDITEKTYTERDPQWLKSEIEKIR